MLMLLVSSFFAAIVYLRSDSSSQVKMSPKEEVKSVKKCVWRNLNESQMTPHTWLFTNDTLTVALILRGVLVRKIVSFIWEEDNAVKIEIAPLTRKEKQLYKITIEKQIDTIQDPFSEAGGFSLHTAPESLFILIFQQQNPMLMMEQWQIKIKFYFNF